MNLLLSSISLFLAWFLVLTIPGPNFMATTQYSISVSRRAGIMIAFGVSTGAATWATASLVGISQVFQSSLWLYTMIKVVGGCYLAYMGLNVILKSFKSTGDSFKDKEIHKIMDSRSAFRVGLFTSYSNPKTAVFFGSLFVMSFPPQAPAWFYFVTVCMVFSASVIWYSLVATFFSMPQVQLTYNQFRKVLDKVTGSVFVILGARLVFGKT